MSKQEPPTRTISAYLLREAIEGANDALREEVMSLEVV
jgi:hypothetical protein